MAKWQSVMNGLERDRYDEYGEEDAPALRIYAPLIDPKATRFDENGRETEIACPAFRSWGEARIWADGQMNQENENEPKRRGRPPKVKTEDE